MAQTPPTKRMTKGDREILIGLAIPVLAIVGLLALFAKWLGVL